jgi:hypothetical protein
MHCGIGRKITDKDLNYEHSIPTPWMGTSPYVSLGMQTQWDLWQADQQSIKNIKPLERLVT